MEYSSSGRRAVLEIAISYALILATLWSARPLRVYLGLLALTWIASILLLEARTTRSFGLGVKGFRESLWALALALIVVTIILICAAAFGTLRYQQFLGPRIPLSGYFIWSFVQQFILQNFFFARLLKFLRPPTAIAIAGVLLSLAHLPNPLLVVATLFWGVGACWLFFSYRNLYVVAMIHFLFGAALATCIPTSLLPNMRVGHGYSHYHHVSRSSPEAKTLPPQQPPRRVQ